MGGKGKGKAPPPAGGEGKSKEEIAEERKKKREAERAALEAHKEAERAHTRFLEGLPEGVAADIGEVDWSQGKRQILLAGGTSLVELSDGSIVCLRRSPQPRAEVMADRIAVVLGLRVPKYRMVRVGDEEYDKIAQMTAETPAYVLDTPMTFENFVGELKLANSGEIPTELLRPIVEKLEFTSPLRCAQHLDLPDKPLGTIFVMEFVRGRGLDQSCGTLPEDTFKGLGQVCALDALLNQSNQVPLPVWRESGKLTNIMVGSEDQAIVAIDLQVNVIKGEELAEYNSRLKLMVSQIMDPSLEPTPVPKYDISRKEACDEVSKLLTKGGFEVTEASTAAFMQGLSEGCQMISRCCASGSLEAAVRDAEVAIGELTSPQTDDTTSSEYADFVLATAAALAEAMKCYE